MAARGGSQAPCATLRGSDRVTGQGILSEHETAYLVAVDGRAIPNGRETWNEDRPLTPGRHTVAVFYQNGSDATGCILSFVAAPGGRYELRSDERAYERVLLWIADIPSGGIATVWVRPAPDARPRAAAHVQLQLAALRDYSVLANRAVLWAPRCSTSEFGVP